jgi:hypothetical protein
MPLNSRITPPIFVLGIMPRCGTNFLSNLLQLHPGCVAPESVWEDYALAHTDLLDSYCKQVTDHWESDWGVTTQTKAVFKVAIGHGIASFLTPESGEGRVICKTPSVENLGSFFQYFPESQLIILVRDGRDLIESGIRSFGWNREAALHWLADAAGMIVDFDRNQPEQENRYRIIRYEDLWLEPEKTLRGLLDFLELDSGRYDFGRASELPLRGSSELLAEASDGLHWDPVERDHTFDPLSRHRHWSNFMHDRYQQVAGKQMERLGYVNEYSNSSFYWPGNQLLNMAWALKCTLRPLYRRLRKHA